MKNQNHVTPFPAEESPTLVDRVIALSPVIRVPLCLARDGRLAPWDWNIITALLIFTNGDGWAWPSRKTLAAVLELPDDHWPTQFYERLKKVTQQQQNGRTFYHIAPDPDGHCAWLPNTICRWRLTATGWRILTGTVYVCFSDALSADPDHNRRGPLEIGPHQHQRILKHAGVNDTKNQRLRYLRRALDEFGKHGWLEDGDYPGAYFLKLPNSIETVSVRIREHPGVHEAGKMADAKLPETGNRLPETGNWLPETGNWLPETGNRFPETGNRLRETGKSAGFGKRLPETGNRLPETGKMVGARLPETGNRLPETGPGTELEPIKSFLTYIGTESRPGSRPEQPEKKNGKKQEGGLTQGQLQSDSDLKDSFQREGFPTVVVNPSFEVTEKQKELALQIAALNIIPVERLSKYLN